MLALAQYNANVGTQNAAMGDIASIVAAFAYGLARHVADRETPLLVSPQLPDIDSFQLAYCAHPPSSVSAPPDQQINELVLAQFLWTRRSVHLAHALSPTPLNDSAILRDARTSSTPSAFPAKRHITAVSANSALAAGSRDGELHAAVLCLTSRRIVGSDRIRLAEALSRHETRIDALRDHVLHHVVSAFLRQDEVGRDSLFHQPRPNRC